jgi:hypothetical protein
VFLIPPRSVIKHLDIIEHILLCPEARVILRIGSLAKTFDIFRCFFRCTEKS